MDGHIDEGAPIALRWCRLFLPIVVLCGCATTQPPNGLTLPERAVDPVLYSAQADKRDSPAAGSKGCTISQIFSLHQRFKDRERAATAGSPGYIGDFPSNVGLAVARDGQVGITVTSDTYPGTTQYFLIGGKRYSGNAAGYVVLDKAAVTSLGNGDPFQYTWTDWPYKSGHDQEDAIVGFQQAYEECLAFMKR